MNVDPIEPHSSLPPIMHDLRDVSRRTNLGRTFLYDKIKKGQLKVLKAGRRTLVTEESLRDFIRTLEEESERTSARFGNSSTRSQLPTQTRGGLA